MATKDTGGQDRARRAEEVEETDAAPAPETGGVQERVSKLTDDVDALLDDIDDVLEQDAESFVKAYVQKGGE